MTILTIRNMNQFHLVWNKALRSNKLFIGFYFKHEYNRQDVGQGRRGETCYSVSGGKGLPRVLFRRLFFYRTKSNQSRQWVRLGSIIELNRTHRKVPVRLCSIAEPIELQSNDWIRLGFGSVSFDWLRRVGIFVSKRASRRNGYIKTPE